MTDTNDGTHHRAASTGPAILGVQTALTPLQTTDDPLFVTLFLAGFGLVALFGGWRRYRTSRIVANTPTGPPLRSHCPDRQTYCPASRSRQR